MILRQYHFSLHVAVKLDIDSKLREISEFTSAACDIGELGLRTHIIQYKGLQDSTNMLEISILGILVKQNVT